MITEQMLRDAQQALGPGATMQALGDRLGVSKQRIGQLVLRYDIPWRRRRPPRTWPCPGCGDLLPPGIGRYGHHRECRPPTSFPLVRCAWCNRSVPFRHVSEYTRGIRRNPKKLWYCSRKCFGKYQSKLHGINAPGGFHIPLKYPGVGSHYHRKVALGVCGQHYRGCLGTPLPGKRLCPVCWGYKQAWNARRSSE